MTGRGVASHPPAKGEGSSPRAFPHGSLCSGCQNSRDIFQIHICCLPVPSCPRNEETFEVCLLTAVGHGASVDDTRMFPTSFGRLSHYQWCGEEETEPPYSHLLFAGHLCNQMFLMMWDLLLAPLCYGMKMWFWIGVAQC